MSWLTKASEAVMSSEAQAALFLGQLAVKAVKWLADQMKKRREKCPDNDKIKKVDEKLTAYVMKLEETHHA